MFGDGDRPIVYQLYCNGYETNITHCSKNTYLKFSCNRQSIAGIRCKHGLNNVAKHVQGLILFYRLFWWWHTSHWRCLWDWGNGGDLSGPNMGDGVWTRMGRGRCSCDLQATTATRWWWLKHRAYNDKFNIAAWLLLQVLNIILILPLASLTRSLYFSVVWGVQGMKHESLIVLQTT